MLSSAVRRAASAQPQSLQTLLSPNRAPAPAYMNAAKNRVLENQIKFQAQSDIPVYLRGRGKMYFRVAQVALLGSTATAGWQMYQLVVGKE